MYQLTVNVSGAKLIAIHIESLATLHTGTSRYMTTTGDFEDENGVKLTGDYLKYSSTYSNVLAVNENGLISGVGDGTAILQVQARGIEGVNVFTVDTDPVAPRKVVNGFEVDVYPRAITLPFGGATSIEIDFARSD